MLQLAAQLPHAASEDQPPPVADTARFPLHGHHRPCFHLPLIICQRAVKGVDGGRGAGRETQQGLRAHLVGGGASDVVADGNEEDGDCPRGRIRYIKLLMLKL